MVLKVDPAGLAALPAQLDRMQVDANKGQQYVMAYTQLSFGGILNGITGSHSAAVEKVRAFLDELANPVAGNTADAVRAAITYYKKTDRASADKLDATYPATDPKAVESEDGGEDSGHSAAAFTDVAHPADHYQPPPDRSAQFPFEPTALALISPAAFARTVIVEATTLASHLGLGHPWDPYEAILKPLTGDWNGLRGCTDVFENVAAAVEDMSANTHEAAGSVHTVWEGNAADGAVAYLLRLASALEAAKEPLEELAKAYEKAAEGAHELFNTLGDILNDVIDAVIIFIAEASMAGATSETVVGGIIFGAGAAYEAYKVYRYIREAIECYMLAYAIIETLRSAQHGFGVVDGDAKLPTLDETRPPLPGDQSSVGRPTITAAPPPTVTQAPAPPAAPTSPPSGSTPRPTPPPGSGTPGGGRPGTPSPSPQPAPQP